MKCLLTLILFCSAATCPLSAQVVDASACDILANPQSFDGKTVRIKGTVIAGFDEFAVKASGCNQVANPHCPCPDARDAEMLSEEDLTSYVATPPI